MDVKVALGVADRNTGTTLQATPVPEPLRARPTDQILQGSQSRAEVRYEA
jgi:hypothetical protein